VDYVKLAQLLIINYIFTFYYKLYLLYYKPSLLRIVFRKKLFNIIEIKFNTIYNSDALVTYCTAKGHSLNRFFLYYLIFMSVMFAFHNYKHTLILYLSILSGIKINLVGTLEIKSKIIEFIYISMIHHQKQTFTFIIKICLVY